MRSCKHCQDRLPKYMESDNFQRIRFCSSKCANAYRKPPKAVQAAKGKPGMFESKKYRNAAKGQPCTLNIVGVCNYDPETVVFCHFPDESNGMGKKSDDISGGDGCSACHDMVDGRVPGFALMDKEFYMRRSQTRTLRNRIERGIVKL